MSLHLQKQVGVIAGAKQAKKVKYLKYCHGEAARSGISPFHAPNFPYLGDCKFSKQRSHLANAPTSPSNANSFEVELFSLQQGIVLIEVCPNLSDQIS